MSVWTMRARLAIVACALAVTAAGLTLSRCSDDGVADGGGDAALDHGREFHYLDTGDEGDGSDGACSVTSDWPGFRRLTEFDPCLPADVLSDPDAGYQMTWTDCGDAGISGCKQLVQLVPQQFAYAYATHDDAGSANLLYLDQGIDNSLVRQFDIIDIKTSARLGEWRIDVDKSNGTEVDLPNTAGTTVAFFGYKPGLFAELAPASSLFTNPLSLSAFPTAPTQPINSAMTDKILAWQPFAGPYAICTVDTGTCVPMDTASIAPAVLYLTFAWGKVAFAVAEHGTTGWAQEYVIHADGSIYLLRDRPNAHIWAMTTDGTTLVWEETYGSTNFLDPQTTTEVWSAPFTTDKATLDATATKVATLPTAGLPGGAGIANLDFFNGLYATYLKAPADVIYVVDVATGKTQTVPKGPGGIMLGLPYVDRNELWEITRTVNYLDSMVRIEFPQPWD